MLAPTPAAFAAESKLPSIHSTPAAQEPPTQVRALLTLLGDPAVQKWLTKEGVLLPSAKAAAPPVSASAYFAGRVNAVREHVVALTETLPQLPADFAGAASGLRADLGDRARTRILSHLALFIGLGFVVEWLFRMATRRLRRRLDSLPVATVHDRLRIVAERFLLAVGLVVAFALGSIGTFMVFDWTPLLRRILLGYLVAFLILRLAIVLGHFLLSPAVERFRIVPMEDRAARFWQHRLGWFVGWFAFGWVTVDVYGALGFSLEERQLVAYALGLGLLVIALETVWRRPAALAAAEAADMPRRRFSRGTRNALLSAGMLLLWALWVARAMPSFWLLLVVMVLPLASHAAGRAVDHLLRPPGAPEAEESAPGLTAVCLERGIRAILIIAAVAVLIWGWGIDFNRLAAQDTLLDRLLHGLLSAVIVILVADFLWRAAKTAIDRKLALAADPGLPNTEEAHRQARLRTLLPIFRNVLFVVVIVVAAMMVLSALGVAIGPLIAGAGIVGVAVGFGAQTFVRDIIAGMFYLIDDAFRVGEYIQSGSYKGTVEGFSIRSVRLRHQRGPIYTVPFGILGAVENLSRDWVIDKMTIGISYDSDIELARKLIKQIGLDLAKDPEFAPVILQPLKMQGVDAFGDSAVQIRMKMMTLPGENFVARRTAFARIKKAFDANGIKFAHPTVQMAGDGEPAAAAAQRALTLAAPEKAVA